MLSCSEYFIQYLCEYKNIRCIYYVVDRQVNKLPETNMFKSNYVTIDTFIGNKL